MKAVNLPHARFYLGAVRKLLRYYKDPSAAYFDCPLCAVSNKFDEDFCEASCPWYIYMRIKVVGTALVVIW